LKRWELGCFGSRQSHQGIGDLESADAGSNAADVMHNAL
jgi:hypothetical protein